MNPKNSIEKSQWPKVDKNALIKDEISIVLQVNGKLRANMLISIEDLESEIKNKALSQENIKNTRITKK